MLCLAGQYLYLVAAAQLMAQRNELVVDFRPDAMTAEKRVDLKGKVESRATCRHCLYLAFRGEHEDF